MHKQIPHVTVILGIESTAHTFGVGLVEDGRVLANHEDMHRPVEGGIRPSEAATHHREVGPELVKKAMIKRPDAVAYSASPGIGSCLKVGTELAQKLAEELGVPLVPVNHAISHLEIGIHTTGAKEDDVVAVYVSGGNTQIIARSGVKGWQVFGETLDIALGNALDKLARQLGLPHPGGPKLEKLAERAGTSGDLLDMPYVVKGMDLSYSGMFTHATRMLARGESPERVARAFQEHAFAMLVEVTERAVAHTGKGQVLLVGGVVQNRRLRDMFDIMCRERGVKCLAVPPEFAGDNGVMIAHSGWLRFRKGWMLKPEQAGYFQKMRVNEEPYNLLAGQE
ncbi:MAG TPA: tRNA (adenosine(37)-N6)-threonylcarbamoyltransferase complex transferase subunit TsaD [archaeon]|nr:tRNA (adenosine(37)-N6)-threonylcarbamoyltransferase complex transferase subunit TsaD [archaeon]